MRQPSRRHVHPMILSENRERFSLTQADVRALRDLLPAQGRVFVDSATAFCQMQDAQHSLRARLYQGTPEQNRTRAKFWATAFHQNRAEDALIRAEFWSRWAAPTEQVRSRAAFYREKAEQDRMTAQVWMTAQERMSDASDQEEAEQDRMRNYDQRTRGAASIGSDGGMNCRFLSGLLKRLNKEARRRTTIALALLHRQNRADRALCVIRIYFQRGQLRARASALDGDASPANAPVELSPLSPPRVRPNQSAGDPLSSAQKTATPVPAKILVSPQNKTRPIQLRDTDEGRQTTVYSPLRNWYGQAALAPANDNLHRSTSAASTRSKPPDPLTRSRAPPCRARHNVKPRQSAAFSTCPFQLQTKNGDWPDRTVATNNKLHSWPRRIQDMSRKQVEQILFERVGSILRNYALQGVEEEELADIAQSQAWSILRGLRATHLFSDETIASKTKKWARWRAQWAVGWRKKRKHTKYSADSAKLGRDRSLAVRQSLADRRAYWAQHWRSQGHTLAEIADKLKRQVISLGGKEYRLAKATIRTVSYLLKRKVSQWWQSGKDSFRTTKPRRYPKESSPLFQPVPIEDKRPQNDLLKRCSPPTEATGAARSEAIDNIDVFAELRTQGYRVVDGV